MPSPLPCAESYSRGDSSGAAAPHHVDPAYLVGAHRGRVLGIAVGLMDAVRIAQAEWRDFGRWG